MTTVSQPPSCPHSNLRHTHEWSCHVLWSSISLGNPSSLQWGNEWREVTKDKTHCRAGQGLARRGLYFPPDRTDKGHQGLAGIGSAAADPKTRPILWVMGGLFRLSSALDIRSLYCPLISSDNQLFASVFLTLFYKCCHHSDAGSSICGRIHLLLHFS